MRFVLLGWSLGLALVTSAAPAEVVRGSAAYLERIAVPPGTAFEAVLEDISRADVAATEIGRVTVADAGQPPYGFEIAVDAEAIDPAARYAVRARLTGPDGRLLFTTTRVTPVLTRGAPDTADLRLVRVAAEVPPVPPLPAHGLRLPQSFTGTLPCADCEGIRHHLDLWPDQAYRLRREWLRGADSLVEDAIGRWSLARDGVGLRLHGAGEGAERWDLRGPDTLRLLDRDGNRIVSDLPYDLAGLGRLAPTEVALPLEGGFVYFADAALFEICVTGQTVPVAMEGGYLDAERAYLAAGLDPQAPLMMLVDGALAQRAGMEGPAREHLVIDRLIAAQPGRSCTQARAAAELVGTYWKLTQMNGAAVTGAPDMREPHMILRGGAEPGLAATMGCNRMMGGFDAAARRLSLGPVASTMMACPEPVATLEQAFAAMLERVDGWDVAGQSLILRAGGDPVAIFEAVYLP